MKLKNMNSCETQIVTWEDVDRAIGQAARRELQPKLKQARRFKRIAGVVAILAGALLTAFVLFS